MEIFLKKEHSTSTETVITVFFIFFTNKVQKRDFTDCPKALESSCQELNPELLICTPRTSYLLVYYEPQSI